MGFLGRIALSVAVVGTLACGRERARPEATAVAPRYAAKDGARAPGPRQTLVDEEGKLKPSGEKVGWLELPLGLELPKHRAGHHSFVSRVPLALLTQFFDARVFTSKVELAGDGGVRYVAAEAKHEKSRGMRFDILLSPNRQDGRVRIAIDERPTAVTAPISVPDARSLLSQQQERAE